MSTATDAGLFEAVNPTGFNPLNSNSELNRIMAIELPVNLSSFKPAMIAHYIGIGQVAAMRISAYLKKDPELDQDLVGLKKPVSKDRVKLEDGTLSVSTNNMNGARKTEWSKEQVLAEAERCLSCGTCNQCGQCVQYCPEASIQIHDSGLVFDLFHCKGCGICAYECPRGVISMEDTNS